jgi:superfamily II DNA or RNA helicase
MIVAYMLQQKDPTRLCAYVFSAEISEGMPLGAHKYPHHPTSLLVSQPAGVTLKPCDRRILMGLLMQETYKGKDIFFSGRSAYTLVKDMIETGRCYLWSAAQRPLRWDDEVAMDAVWSKDEESGRLVPSFDAPRSMVLLPCTPPIGVDTETGAGSPVRSSLPEDVAGLWQEAQPMDAAEGLAFIERLTRRFPDVALPLPPHVSERRRDEVNPAPVLTLTGRRIVRGGGDDEIVLLARLGFEYGRRIVTSADRETRVRYVEKGTLVNIGRNEEAETAARAQLAAFGMEAFREPDGDLFSSVTEAECLCLPPEAPHDWGDALDELFPGLEASGWKIRYDKGYRLASVDEADWYSDFTSSAKGWLTFETGIRVKNQRVNLLPHVHALLRRHRDWRLDRFETHLATASIPIPARNCVVLVEGTRFFQILRNVFELFGEATLDRRSRLRLSELRAAELVESDALLNVTWEPPPKLRELARVLRGEFRVAPCPAPEGLACALRPYQEVGAGWLAFLREHQLGGILADDMGLGKTVQALAFIVAEKERGDLDLPVLVVAPTSVLPNWRAEAARFAPGLNVLVMHGADRHDRLDQLDEADVVITSYALLRIDQGTYHERSFSTIILDEAQAIKNPSSKVARVAYRLKGRLRVCLTGTPIENHLGELWSLMHFAMPGFLGTKDGFRRDFQLPIEQVGHPVVRETLRRRIGPFVLRRTKDEVALDLPEKTTIVQTASLSDVQVDLYQSVRMAMTARVREEMEAKGMARSRIVILDALLKLRQICCDPRLKDKQHAYNLPQDSCKLDLLAGMLPEMIEEGRRILLFSQFTSMLDLIKQMLDADGLPYVELRGSTVDRETPVRCFQEGEVPLFLISLRAGGLGLNLTAADTVIHYDPWWNPAVEDQATDRAHRIGQDKPVFVYKFVTENTVEARILKLQEKKRALTAILDGGEGGGLSLSEEDIDLLLAPVR